MNKRATLIKLIIVVAFIGILSTKTIPMYQTHIILGMKELNGATSQYELIINNCSTSGKCI